MRALVLTPDFPPQHGGIQLLMHRLVEHMRELEPEVVTLASRGDRDFDSKSGLDVARVARRGGRLRRLAIVRLNAAAIRHAVRRRPQLIVNGHAVTAPAAAMIRALSGGVLLQYLYANELGTRPHLVSFALRRADRAVAISRHTRDMALEAGADPDRLALIHPGVDLPQSPRRDPADRPTVLTISRLADPHKGHDQMLRALPLVRGRVPDVQWVVIGDGPLRRSLERQAESIGVAEAVRFLGSVPDPERDAWLEQAHVFALPSRLPPSGIGGEGFGIVFLEASAHGVPVVAGAVGGALDAVQDGRTGYLVDPGDHVALAEAIAGLLQDPQRAASIGQAGARWARRFTWDEHARAVERLFDDARRDPR